MVMRWLGGLGFPKNHPWNQPEVAWMNPGWDSLARPGGQLNNTCLVGGIPTILKNMKVNGKDYPIYEMENKIHVPKQQPAVDELTSCWLFSKCFSLLGGWILTFCETYYVTKKNLHILTPPKKDMRNMKSENGVPKSTGWWWFQLFPPLNGQNLG